MKFMAPRNTILESLVHCMDVAKKGLNDISKGVLVDVGAKEVWFTSIASPLCVRSDVNKAKPVVQGVALVKADALFEHVKAMTDGDITITLKDSSLVITGAGTRKYTINTLPTENFPKFPDRPEAKACTLPGAALRQLIERVAYALPGVGGKPEISGIFVKTTPGAAESCATNGMVVAIVTEEDDDIEGTSDFFITSDGHRAVLSLMGSVEQDRVDVYVVDNRVHVVCDAGEVDYLLPATGKIDVAGIIRDHAPNEILTLDRSALLAAAKAVAVGADKSVCRVAMRFAGGQLSMTTRTDHGTNEEALQTSGEADFELTMNAHLIAATLAPIDADTVSIGADNGNMVAIRATGVLATINKIGDEVPNAAAA